MMSLFNICGEMVGAVYMFTGGVSGWSQYAKLRDVSGYTNSMGATVVYDSSTGLLASGTTSGKCFCDSYDTIDRLLKV